MSRHSADEDSIARTRSRAPAHRIGPAQKVGGECAASDGRGERLGGGAHPAGLAGSADLRPTAPGRPRAAAGESDRSGDGRSEEHTSELQSQSNLVCRLLLEKKKKKRSTRCRIRRLPL